MAKKVLILHTSVGLGHKSMAENIGFYLAQAGMVVKLADIGKVQKGRFESIVVGVHQFINIYLPFVWAWLYRFGHYAILPFRVLIAGFNYRSAKILVDEFGPDLIISTQTTSSAVVAYLKQKGFYKNLFGIAFSDYHLHPYWLYNQVDFYLVNIAEQKQVMVKQGIDANKIFVCGMTLKPKTHIDAAAIKNRLGIGPQEKVVLVASGSLGTGLNENLLEKLSALANVKVIVVCGKSEQHKKQLGQKYAHYKNLLIFGFYSPMQELYAIADVFLTKPGGLTVAEALQYRLPMIITHCLPGQEQLNVDYLKSKQLVMVPQNNIVALAKKEMDTGEFKQSLAINSNLADIAGPKISSPAAITEVLQKFHLSP